MNEWARRGATARLAEIESERTAILLSFPDLASSKRSVKADRTPAVDMLGRRRRRILAAGKKRMSEGMRKYWAKRRAAEKKDDRNEK